MGNKTRFYVADSVQHHTSLPAFGAGLASIAGIKPLINSLNRLARCFAA